MIADGGGDPSMGRLVTLGVIGGGAYVWFFRPEWLPVIGMGLAGAAGLAIAAVAAGAGFGRAYEAAEARRERRERAIVERAAEIAAERIAATASNRPVQAETGAAAPTPAPEAPEASPAPAAVTPMTRQAQVGAFVAEFRARRGREPSFTEVRNGLGLPKSSASKYLDLVLKQG